MTVLRGVVAVTGTGVALALVATIQGEHVVGPTVAGAGAVVLGFASLMIRRRHASN